ncbi:MAG: 1-acyl-sn-glycerol-3-phosphate acyltransferase [Clostridiales Family XIII bacterium]|jgi:1-acyl-sn-glycerol-3-phosphate acyltransferase|nr:1-acyl-sn-glycerol-3-phosphate acyltransferase [Clostridiales Family XIII bacterium]
MNIIRNASFAAWMIGSLWQLRPMRRGIDRARAAGDYVTEREEILKATTSWGSRIVKHYGVTLEVSGETALPAGPVLFVSNHEAYGDIVMFTAAITNKQFGFIAKGALGKLPLFGKWILRIRSLFLKRDDARETLRVFKIGDEYLEEGFSLVIFPEGTRRLGNPPKPFNRGSFKLATRAEVPIVPVSISGTYDLYEKNGYPSPGVVKFHIHPAVATTGLRGSESKLCEQVENTIKSKLEEWTQ